MGTEDLKTEDKTIKGAINEVNTNKANATDLTTHTGDTDIHITTTERTKWNEVVNKANKTEVLLQDKIQTATGTETHDNVYSAKLTKTELDKKANATDLTTHTDDTDIHTSATEKASYVKKSDAFVYRKVNNIDCEEGSWITQFISPTSENGTFPNACTWQKIEQFKAKDFVHQICTSHTSNSKSVEMHVRYAWCNQAKIENAVWSSWLRVCATSVADVAKTSLAWAETTYFENAFTGCHYQVKNGVCFVNIDMICNSPMPGGYKIPITLPEPNTDYVHSGISSLPKPTYEHSSITLAVTGGGTHVLAYGGITGDRYLGTFSYPVKE